MPLFLDRREAGQRLAVRLAEYADQADVVVFALPRGGVPVAFEVAAALRAPLEVFPVRKIGAPGHPEFAIGAIAPGGGQVLSPAVIVELGISPHTIEQIIENERLELERRERIYRGDRAMIPVRGKTAIVIDDGLATGSTMEAAVIAIRHQGAATIVAAAPVASAESCRRLSREADAIVCVEIPEPFSAVGLWYRVFDQTTDDEVIQLLRLATASTSSTTERIQDKADALAHEPSAIVGRERQ